MHTRLASLSCLITFGALLFVPVAEAAEFPDMNRSFFRYQNAVEFLVDRGVIQGYPDGTFKPEQPINRAEFLKVVLKGKGGVTPVNRPCFTDVDAKAWYAPYVCAAARRGIVSGYPDGSFKPEQIVNTAEAIKIVLGAYDKHVEEPTGEEWYKPYIAALAENNVLSPHSFLPWEELTRERAADLVARVLQFEEDRTIPRYSSGCGKAPPTTPPSTLSLRGMEHTFILDVPEEYVSHDPVPLIIAFHGRTNSNEEVRQYYELTKYAKDYIVAYPDGTKQSNGSYSWAANGEQDEEIRGVEYFDALTEKLSNMYCIDMDRIFTVGHSLGAWMANSVACIRGDVVRGSGTVGGNSVVEDCRGPAAAFLAHNPHDQLAPFSATERTRTLRVEENACTWDTVPSEPSSMNCVLHSNCADGNPVLWCPHEIDTGWHGEYYPHNWPKGTAEHIIEFFDALP